MDARRNTFRARAVAMLAAGAALGALVVAAPAQAAGVTQVTYVTGTTDQFMTAGLYRRGAVGELNPVTNLTNRRAGRVVASSDGSRFAYDEAVISPLVGQVEQRLVVRDASGRLVRTIRSVLTPDGTSGILIEDVVISPTGNAVYWTERNQNNQASTVYAGDVTTGVVTPVVTGQHLIGLYDLATLIVAPVNSASDTQNVVSLQGTTIGTVTLGIDPVWATLSPDGQHLAWSRRRCVTNFCNTLAFDLVVGTKTLLGVTPNFTVTNPTDDAYVDASFTPDGGTVRFVKTNAGGGQGDVGSVPTAGGSATMTPTADLQEFSAAYVSPDAVAPGPVTASAATVGGTSAAFTLTMPNDLDLSAVVVSRSSAADGVVQSTMAPPSTGTTLAWTDTGLTLGRTYTYRFQALDRSGNVGPETDRVVTTLAVATSTPDPVSAVAAAAAFPVTFVAAGWTVPAGVTFDVDWTGGDGVWHPWLRHVAGTTHTFGTVGTLPATTPIDTALTGTVTTTSVPGTSYRFRVKAFDLFDNSTAALVSGPAVVPFDQTKAAFSAGTPITKSASAWLGSFRSLVKAGQFAKLTIVGNRFQLVGWKCAACGVVDVFDGATRIGTVDTRSAKAVVRTVLFTKTWVTVATRVITIKARGTAGRPAVQIDGFGVRR
jgi:hypothetical protein